METQGNEIKPAVIEKKKVNWILIGKFFKGNILKLVISTVFLVFAVLAAYTAPMITSFTVDYVLGDKPSSLPERVMEIIDFHGGREMLRDNLYICAIALVLCTVLNGAMTYARRKYVAVASEGITKKMRDMLYTHLQAVPYDYHKHVSTGDLVQRCTSDVDTIRRFITQQLLEIIRTLSMIAVAAVIMFGINVKLAVISVFLMPLLTATSFIYFKRVQSQFELSDEAEGKLSATIQENLTGVRVVRAFAQQHDEVEKFTACNKDFKDKTYKLIRLLALFWGASDFAGYLQIAITLFFGVLYTVRGDITLGEMLMFTTYVAMLTWPVRHMGRILADMGKAKVSLGRLDEILSTPVESEPGLAQTPAIVGKIEFRDVCFGYDRYDDVINHMSFTAEPGQTIAILGSTGSGKSSLVQLLQRLYTCTAGEILIDGVNVNDIQKEHLRRNIGIVLQEPFLYSRTIMENIRLVRPDATDEEVFAAAKVASVHDVISSFENGYDTIVGERGVTLSGGQKQRVAIARMLMQNAPILVFDDSMSAVDTETDAAIREALKSRRANTTTFIISHRITTLSESDKILVIEHGVLVQEGTHEELLQQEGLYKRIAHIQNQLEDELKIEGGEA